MSMPESAHRHGSRMAHRHGQERLQVPSLTFIVTVSHVVTNHAHLQYLQALTHTHSHSKYLKTLRTHSHLKISSEFILHIDILNLWVIVHASMGNDLIFF